MFQGNKNRLPQVENDLRETRSRRTSWRVTFVGVLSYAKTDTGEPRCLSCGVLGGRGRGRRVIKNKKKKQRVGSRSLRRTGGYRGR